MNDELSAAIQAEATKNQWDPMDLATAISYETAGTFDPWKAGPMTMWGRHRGLIQWGEPQREQYGIHFGMPVADQMAAVSKYLLDRGVKPGDGLLQIYAAINAGDASRINASDASNGGAPGTVYEKVTQQMDGHRKNAAALLGGTYTPIVASREFTDEYGRDPPDRPDLGVGFNDVPVTPAPKIQLPDGPAPSLWQTTKDAFMVEQTLPWIINGTASSGIFAPPSDPSWLITPERLKADFEARGLPTDEQYLGMVSGSRSEEEYINFLDTAQANLERTQRLARSGMAGVSLQIANQFLDPVALAADIVAGSVAPELVLARRGTRLARVLYGGIGGAAGSFAGESIQQLANPNHRQSAKQFDDMVEEATRLKHADLLLSTVLGFGIGGAVGGLFRGSATLHEGADLQRAAQRTVADYEDSVSPISINAGSGDSVGASRNPLNPEFLKDDALNALTLDDFAKTAFREARFSLSAHLNTTKNTVVRAMSGLVQDGVGKVDGALNPIAASEVKDRLVSEFSTRIGRVVEPQVGEYMRRNNVPFWQASKARYDLGTETNRFMYDRRANRTELYSPEAVKIGTRLKELYAEIQKLQKNPGARDGLTMRPVYGANEIPDNADWTGPRYVSNERVILARAEYADGELERLYEGAIARAQANLQLDPQLLKRVAGAYVGAIVKRAHGLDVMANGHVSAEDMAELVQTLVNHGGLSKPDAEALLHSFRKHGSDSGRDASQRHRLLLDENYRLEGANGPRRKDGTIDEQGLGVFDLLEQDALANFHRYVRPTMGRLALARYQFRDPRSGELVINGIVNDGEFRKLLDAAAQKNADLLARGEITPSQASDILAKMEFAYNAVMGRPLSDGENTAFGHAGRLIRKFNFVRLMNQVGFAQVPEIGKIIGTLGPKAAFSQMPALRRVMSMDGETILQNGLGRDLELFIPIGNDRLVAHADYRFDDLTGIHDAPQAGWRAKAEHFLDVSGRVTGELSGLTQVNVMMNRWVAKAVVQKFADFASTGKGFSMARLADLGLDADMTKRVVAMFKEPGNFSYEPGWITGQKVVRARFDKWADPEAAEAFRSAAYRFATQVVQKNDIGNMMTWMSTPAAKMLMQFRTFMVGAYEKQTLKGVHFRDTMAVSGLAGSLGFAALAYIAQTKVQAIGREDADEFLEDRLSWANIGAATFARAGESSIVPMLVDTVTPLIGADPVFSRTRTTGQVSNAILGNPAVGLIDDLPKATAGLAGLVTGDGLSQQEVKALLRILPFGNALPVIMGTNAMISDLPEFDRR